MAALLLLSMALPVSLAGEAIPARASVEQEATTLDLIISDVSILNVSYHSAVVLWKTNIKATSQVFYDTRSHYYIESYGYQTPKDISLVSQHSVVLSGLRSGTRYYLRVRSTVGGAGANSDEYSFRTRSDRGDSGGRETTYDQEYLIVDLNGELTGWPIGSNGHLLQEVMVTSEGGEVAIRIPDGTLCLDAEKKCLHRLLISPAGEAIEYRADCPLPDDGAIPGRVYDIGPDGSTFSPYAQLTLAYDEADIPEGIAEDDLYLAWCRSGGWTPLASTVDSRQNTVSAEISHLTSFAIMMKTPPYFSPAEFTTADLNVSPSEVTAGGKVTITVAVSNTGGTEGCYPVSLWLGDTLEETKEVVLAPHTTKTVAFAVSRTEPGIYSVSIAGLTGSFRVRETITPVPSPTSGSGLPADRIILIALIGIAILLAIFLPSKRKKRKTTPPQGKPTKQR
ncbi:MAG: fibronectin type III domain-containing protein [Dehalococcoidales bacterium]|nr:fibronectin type III domain-containing protein [Dehalococcoidales bacterium]